MPSPPDGFAVQSQNSLRKILAAMEGQTAAAMEELVAGEGFSTLLVRFAENGLAVSKIWADVWDLMLHGLRLAGRRDIDRLARQLIRNEDKLELVLQEVEQLRASFGRR
jgi:hypothetical protein